MPPLPGEERLLTVYADVHYYFTAPIPKPIYHRFDKGSYLYVYHDPVRGTARIEIANNPGTPDQDAFFGALDRAHLCHSTRFPTLCTLTVKSSTPASSSGHVQTPGDQDWILPFTDPRDGAQRLLRLHTLDIYFWTVNDADLFLDSVERLLPPGQLESDRLPKSQSTEPAMSSVVQKLENVAISESAYQNSSTCDLQSKPVSEPSMITSSVASVQVTLPASQQIPKTSEPADYTPLAYNPAAPPAPEPIKPREKTPPPPDAADGTGLAAAALADQSHVPSQAPPVSYTSQATGYGIPGLPQSGYISPPPSAGFGQSYSTAATANVHSYHAPPVSGVGTTYMGGPPLTAPLQGPNTQTYSHQAYGAQQFQQQQQQQQQQHISYHPQPQHYESGHGNVNVAGYTNYAYGQPAQQPNAASGSEYDIHNQVYIPTEDEAKHYSQGELQQAISNPGARPHKLEDRAAKVEKTVNGFLKKLEKRIG